MEPLTDSESQKLHKSIRRIYTLHNLDRFGVEALSIVDRLVRSEIPMFYVNQLQPFGIVGSFLPDFPGLTPAMESVVEQYFGEHPIVQYLPQTLTGAYKISDFISTNQLHSLDGLYQQYLKLLDIEDQMVLFLPDDHSSSQAKFPQTPATLVGLSFHRPQCNFTERDRAILNLLQPHLAQAYTNARQYQQLEKENYQLQQSLNHLGTISLDREGLIQSIAPQAIIWLETYFGRSSCAKQLPDHLRSWVKYQINCLTKNPDLPEVCLPLRMQHAGRELTIQLVIEPTGDRHILLLTEQTQSTLESLSLLGLSQRETEVLKLVIQGKDNKAIASELSVHISTVRKHLEHIYLKWKVKSRTEAIAYALTKLGVF
jgi:DNA-binding CsgD family transcriptional regulator